MLIVESTGRCIRNSTVAVLGNTNNRKKKMNNQFLTSDSLQGKARQGKAKRCKDKYPLLSQKL